MPKPTAKTTKSGASRAGGAPAAKPSPEPGWPAGLDALAKAQREGARMFESLRRQSQLLEQKTKQAVDSAAAARDAAAAKAREVGEIAGGTWDKLEHVFEDRVARALSRLGFYTQQDIERLAERVDALAQAVDRLQSQMRGESKARGAKPPPAAKRARKRGA